ncbi:Aste57867_248 [Aphanomyces stellatus]|uniref:Aste57867_248 protein n=1 Tax=Aphanomyces stellatus TaxID=120398 RepID=A0A485K7A9_9STRA|nr:hypothetical protein As57867_000248 [Aphanomyces stellatus]VFT77474.1 Aste57867_248 [Aphanomyces stellatus]
MGQNVSADATEIVSFRKMVRRDDLVLVDSMQVKHAYYDNVEKLQKHMYEPSLGYQISRASYLELCNRIEGHIECIPDTLQRETKLEKHVNEKMDFFAAVESGKIVLGDTLLHIAVRLHHVEVVACLLDKGLKENIPNFRGEYAHQVCSHPSMQLLMDDVVLVHDVLGFDYEDEAKVHRIVQSLRTMWSMWMFDSTETTALVKVIGDVRSSHPFLNKYLKITNAMADRYRTCITMTCLPVAITLLKEHDGKAYDAKTAFLHWPTDEKLQLMWDALRTNFPRWRHKKDVEKDVATLRFVDDAMCGWISMADDLRLYLDEVAPPTPEVLQGFSQQIWKSRLAPDPDEVDDLCAHIDGVHNFVRLKHLKA